MFDPPIEVIPMSHSERCLYWANIFSLPRTRFITTRTGKVIRSVDQTSESCLLVAEALRFYAEHKTKEVNT